MNRGKKRGYIILGILIFLLGISSVNAVVVGHRASEFKIKIDGTDRTLQYAIENNLLRGTHTYTSPSSIPDPGHDAGNIWISTDSGEMTLRDALSGGVELKESSFTQYVSVSAQNLGHLATEIILSSGKSFQKSINDGELACIPGTCSSLGYECGTWGNGCGGTINCGTCSVGSCISGICSCVSHTFSACYNNDLYWYDSCGYREEIKQDCGEDSCGSWGSWYKISTCTYRRDRTCYDRGCSAGSCYANSYTDSGTATCPNGGICTESGCLQGGPSVICTELHNMGLMGEETYKIDIEYAHDNFSPEVIRGYQAWAIPIVRAMRNSPEAVESAKFMVDAFMEEINYRRGEKEEGNEIGALFLERGVPLFERIGVHINEPDWKSLFKTQINPLYLDFIESALGNNLLSTRNLIANALEISQDDNENKYDDLVKNYFTEEKVKEMYYDAKEKSNGSDMEFANALLDNLEEAVEEIELMIDSVESEKLES